MSGIWLAATYLLSYINGQNILTMFVVLSNSFLLKLSD